MWIGIYPEYFKYNHVRRILGIPMEVIPLNIISIGWPTGEEKPKEKYDDPAKSRFLKIAINKNKRL